MSWKYKVGDLVKEVDERLAEQRVGLIIEAGEDICKSLYEEEDEEQDDEELSSFITVLWDNGVEEFYELWGTLDQVSWLPIIN